MDKSIKGNMMMIVNRGEDIMKEVFLIITKDPSILVSSVIHESFLTWPKFDGLVLKIFYRHFLKMYVIWHKSAKITPQLN